MTRAARSSGRHSMSEPLLARPIGVRPVATMTASGMWCSSVTGGRGRGRGVVDVTGVPGWCRWCGPMEPVGVPAPRGLGGPPELTGW